MTERALLLPDGSGDGGPYSADELRLLLKALSIAPVANAGVLPDQLNELRISTTGNNNVTIGTGRAFCDGVLFENDAATSFTVTSPSGGTTGKRIVVRHSWASNTVRLTEISSADGTATLPSLTQSSGTTWDIPVCSFTITTGGVIGALNDERRFAGVGFDAGAALRHIARERVLLVYSDFAVVADGAAPLAGALGLLSVGTSSRHAASSDGTNGKVDINTGTGSGTPAGYRTGMAAVKGNLSPRYLCSCIPSAAAAALDLQFFGFFSASAIASGTSNSKAGFRTTTTGNLFAVTGNGSGEQTTDLGVTPATQTRLEVRTDDDGVTWDFYVNGILRASHATTIPVATTAMYAHTGILNNTTTSVSVTSIDYLTVDQNRS